MGPVRLQAARRCGWQAVAMAHDAGGFGLDAEGLQRAFALDASLEGSAPALAALERLAGEAGLKIDPSWVDPPLARAYLKPGVAPEVWHAEGGVPALLLLLDESGALPRFRRGSRLREALEDLEFPGVPASLEPQPGRKPAATAFSLKESSAPARRRKP
jgi:hypothetical protein